MKCGGCGVRTMGSHGFCRRCKSLQHHGHKLIERDGLYVEKVTDTPGSPWCAWNRRGDVVAGPADRKVDVIMELGSAVRG